MKRDKSLTSELFRNIGNGHFGNMLGLLPDPDRIMQRFGNASDVLRKLKDDPHVWSCVQSRKSGSLSLEHIILPDSASDVVTDEIRRILNNIDLRRLESDILDAPLFGRQFLEIIWRNDSKNKRMLVPDRIVAKPQEWFAFDQSGKLKYKRGSMNEAKDIPPMKLISVLYEPTYHNPYGSSLLSKCYWPVRFKNGGIRFWVNFTEKYGMPILLGQYTRGASNEESAKLAEELANMSEDAVIVAPSDIKIEMREAVRSTSVEMYHELITYCNAEISKALLSQTLTTEIGTGSYAASQTHYKIRHEVIAADARLIESAINELIRHIVDLNFGTGKYPKFKLIINEADNVNRAERDVKIAQSGCVKFTKDYWMRTYGFREGDLAE
ncbi:MAG: DUF935 family protein [Chlorobi bacterium]|nr:DUF935 family protein [Chlorobiota bacterium]